MAAPALHLSDLRKSFNGRTAVDGLNLSLAPGEVFALLGPNGAGKTTTLNMILGFLTPDSGRVEVSGANVMDNPLLARSKVAYLPETVMLHPAFSAVENLTYFALLAGHKLAAAKARELLAASGLQAAAFDCRAEGFSKGMRQKVGVAIALAKSADLLLLDEPTSGLDASAANDFSGIVRAASQRGVAVLMATHDLFRVKDVAHRLGILRSGRLIHEADAGTLSPVDLEKIYLRELAA